MRIGIYHEMRGSALGGAAAVVAAMAEVLAGSHEVTILVSGCCPPREAWGQAFGRELGSVTVRSLPQPQTARRWRPWERDLGTLAVGTGFDLVIGSVHTPPPQNCARRGALYVHFPVVNLLAELMPRPSAGPGKRIRWRLGQWAWRRRLRGWQQVVGNSRFTAGYLKEWWGVEAEVLPPPISPPPPSLEKLPLILSVGRFAAGPGNKKQLEMMRAFARLPETEEPWRYRLAGSVGSEPAHQQYLQAVRAAAPPGASVHADAPRATLDEWYASASIFWHATGLGEPRTQPQHMEHFGIVTPEAMAAGCIPVVFAQGGQPEIVTHGVDGFLWETERELLDFTAELQRNPARREAMAAAARAAGLRFGLDTFRERLLTMLSPMLD